MDSPNNQSAPGHTPQENHSLNKHEKAFRAPFHDYTKPGFYLITMSAHPGRPGLSKINEPSDDYLRSGLMVVPDHSPLGDCVEEELLRIPEREPRMRIVNYIIMPDHIHFVLEVSDTLEKPIGKHIAPFSVACSKAYSHLAGSMSVQTLFQPYDDRIIFDYQQLDRAVKYVADNPRRLIIRRRHPDLFRRTLHLLVGDHEYAAFGNLFLLESIWLMPVRIHRRWSDREFIDYRKKCLEQIACGAVPISPAIHKAEKDIMNEAIRMGSPVIMLRDQSFGERFKPSGKQFDLCSEGRLLLLSPWPENLTRRSSAGHAEFHTMNDHAAAIAELPIDARRIIRKLT